MIIAAWTDSLVLRELDFRNDLRTAGAFLKKAARNFLLLLPAFCLDRRFFENRHCNLCACGRGLVNRDFVRAFQYTGALTDRGARRKNIIDYKLFDDLLF